MDQTNFGPGPGFYYPTTPPQAPMMMPFTNYTPQQITPQFEYDSFSFTEPMHVHSGERSLSEPFIFKANNTPPQPARMSISSHVPTQRFPAVPISPVNTTPRVKAKRTPTACEECRKKKQKCDGESPCQSCKEQHTECAYREVPPTKKDNSLEKMIELMEGFSEQLQSLSGRIDAMGAALQHNEQRLALLPNSCWQCGSGRKCQS